DLGIEVIEITCGILKPEHDPLVSTSGFLVKLHQLAQVEFSVFIDGQNQTEKVEVRRRILRMVSPCKEVALEEFVSRSPLIHIDQYLLSLLPRVLPVSHDSFFLEVSAQPEIISWIVLFDQNVSLHCFGTSRMMLF